MLINEENHFQGGCQCSGDRKGLWRRLVSIDSYLHTDFQGSNYIAVWFGARVASNYTISKSVNGKAGFRP